MTIPVLREVLFLILIGSSLFTDIKKGKIYNIFTIPALFLGLMLNALEYGLMGIKTSVFGIAVGMVFFSLFLPSGGLGQET